MPSPSAWRARLQGWGADFSHDVFALSGRVALVSGGNTGLSRAVSVALSEQLDPVLRTLHDLTDGA